MSTHIHEGHFYHEWQTGDWNHYADKPQTDDWFLTVTVEPRKSPFVGPRASIQSMEHAENLNAAQLREAAQVFLVAAEALEAAHAAERAARRKVA